MQTFVMIKPDAVRRGIVGEIISRFENRQFSIVKMRTHCCSAQDAEELYAEHKGKDFYDSLVDFTVLGPVVVMILERHDAVNVARILIGSANQPGTIRADFADVNPYNCVHGSDSYAAFLRESSIFFQTDET